MTELNDKTFIGAFYNEDDLLAKMNELQTTGYPEEHMYVVAKHEDDVSMLRRRTDADVHAAYNSWTDRFMEFVTGEDQIRNLMKDIGLSDHTIDKCYEELRHGGTLLYVDEGLAGDVYSRSENTDPIIIGGPHHSSASLEEKLEVLEEKELPYGGYEPPENPTPEELELTDEQRTSATEDSL